MMIIPIDVPENPVSSSPGIWVPPEPFKEFHGHHGSFGASNLRCFVVGKMGDLYTGIYNGTFIYIYIYVYIYIDSCIINIYIYIHIIYIHNHTYIYII